MPRPGVFRPAHLPPNDCGRGIIISPLPTAIPDKERLYDDGPIERQAAPTPARRSDRTFSQTPSERWLRPTHTSQGANCHQPFARWAKSKRIATSDLNSRRIAFAARLLEGEKHT